MELLMAIMTHVLVMTDLILFVMPKNSVNDNVRLDPQMRLRTAHSGSSPRQRQNEAAAKEVLAGMTPDEIQALLDEIAADTAEIPAKER
jgi:hypothetical protein